MFYTVSMQNRPCLDARAVFLLCIQFKITNGCFQAIGKL